MSRDGSAAAGGLGKRRRESDVETAEALVSPNVTPRQGRKVSQQQRIDDSSAGQVTYAQSCLATAAVGAASCYVCPAGPKKPRISRANTTELFSLVSDLFGDREVAIPHPPYVVANEQAATEDADAPVEQLLAGIGGVQLGQDGPALAVSLEAADNDDVHNVEVTTTDFIAGAVLDAVTLPGNVVGRS
jgi:hypothetical protein